MDLAKLLLKLLYLITVFVILHLFIKPFVGFRGSKLVIIVLTLSTLLTHFTFDKAYDFMKNPEVLIKTGKKKKKKNTITIDDESEDEEEADIEIKNNGMNAKIVKKKVYKKKSASSSSSDYLLDHTHKFIQDKVFDEDKYII